MNRNVVALQDRGHTLVFEPTAEEVHKKTGQWFDQDTDIYEWFSENLHLVREPSMRLYLRASELKCAGMDWMDIVPLAPEDQRQRLVAELQADTSYFVANDDDGNRIRIPMNETGAFTFVRYCEFGASKWIEAHRKGYGQAVIYVGRPRSSSRVEGLRLKPHKIRPVSDRLKKKRSQGPRFVPRTLL